MLRSLRVCSSLSSRHIASVYKGKSPVRPPRLQERPDIGCSYWTQDARFYASSSDGTGHEVKVGFMEDASELEDDMEALDMETVEGDELDDEAELIGPPGRRRPRLPTSQKKLNRLLSRHVMHEIPEDELSERFVKGTGPGGQAINKTNSAVHLLHIPTGIRIRAQPSRLRGKNREAARKLLRMRLDDLRAQGLYPIKEGQSVAEEIVIDPETDTLGSPEETGEVPDKRLDKQGRKEARKAEEIALSAAYSQSELRAAKIRARKAKKAQKAKKKKREKDVAQGEEE